MLNGIVTWTDPTNRFVCKSEPLGSGATKSVFRAFDKELGREVAWSKAPLPSQDAKETADILSEIEMMKAIDHPHLVKLITSWAEKRTNEVVLITELYHGALDAYVRKHGKQEMCVIRKWTIQICKAIEHLHCHHKSPIVHRDIKCANIFINNYTGDVAVGDLGFATVASRSKSNSSVMGTAQFIAPEVLKGRYNHKVDIYALGMSLIEMATQKKPYSRIKNHSQMYLLVLDGTSPDELAFIKNKNLRALIEKCIGPVESRPSIEEVLLEPFITNPEADYETVEDLVTAPVVNFQFFKCPIERYCLTKSD